MFGDRRFRLCEDITGMLTSLLDNFRIVRKLSSSPKEKHWEHFGKNILNLVYGWNLIRLESIHTDFPAVDLGDNDSSICVQVTVENSRDKINSTIKKFEEKKLFDQYKYLKFFLIFSGPNNFKKPFETIGPYAFDKTTDIIAFDKLAKDIEEKNIKEMEKIKEFLQEAYSLSNDEKYEQQKIIIERQQDEINERDKLIAILQEEKLQKESKISSSDLVYENKEGESL